MNNQILTPVKLIDGNPYQPRHAEDPVAVVEIAESIKRNGLMQIPTARELNGRYQLAFGHTRLAAFKLNNEECMPLVVRDLSDLQMFELGVAENVKRRDLNPIELAESMRRYMDEFGKNSAEAGEFFNCSEENVRAKVRLLNLPEPVQTKMRAGEVNENTARTLLSMQRITDDKTIVETLKRVDKEKGNRLPDDIIESTADRLENVVDMWNDNHREGKPRAGYHGWLLNMKNFPNNLLEHLAPGDYVELGLVEKGQLTDAHTAYSLGNKDADLPADLKSKIDHLSNPPACTACPFYTKIRGTHYCGIKNCYERKTEAWMRHQLEQTSKTTGIPLYVESDGRYVLLVSHDDKCNALFTKKHAGLRLISKSKVSGYNYQNFKGIDDDICFVVATGEAITKLGSMSTKSGGGKKSEKEKAEMRAMKIYRARRRELLWECTAVAKSMFDDVPLDVLERINSWHFIGIDDRIPSEYEPAQNSKADVREDFERRALVWRLLVGDTSHYRRDSMASILDVLLDNTNVKPSKALIKLAQQWDAEIDSVAEGGAK